MNLLKHSIMLAMFLYNMITTSSGGDCYELYKPDTKGCYDRILTNITKKDCCALEGVGGTSFGWTETDATTAHIFRLWFDVSGTPDCKPCKVNCDDVDCGPDKKCKMKNGRPRCVCNLNCSKFDAEYDGPVCGTDDNTYERPCNLYRSRCRLRQSIEIAYYGVCSTNSCDHVTCPNGRYCIQDRNHRPHCVECRATCKNAAGGFVCGSDNISYESKCHLQLHSCRFKQVTKTADDRCNDTLNTCEFTSCMDGKKCVDTPDGAECVTCGFSCNNSDYKGKVCGSDNVTYVDRCALMTESCRYNPDLELALNTSCDGGRGDSIPPFLLPFSSNEATTYQSNVEYEVEEEDEREQQITTSYEDNTFNQFIRQALSRNNHNGNRRRINQTKKHNQSAKSGNGNRHPFFQ
ncbi:follistatin-A-like isoform X2 [Antedon mediterranea]|uniref:follistatin-A-like isoform X2 n=1 Tax=Antedon mediterranea TaxID=105859 RepID=UPI003AF79678